MKSSTIRWTTTAAALAAVVLTTASGRLDAQTGETPVSFNVRGGLNVPTFDIADAAEPGASFGLGAKLHLADRLFARGSADFGFHPGADLPTGGEAPDVDVFHYVAGLGYRLTPSGSPWYASVNLGAGAMTFAVDAADDPTYTYFAINAGGEVGYRLDERWSVFLSPQGDIAFSDEDEIGTGDAWVWPISLGVEVRP